MDFQEPGAQGMDQRIRTHAPIGAPCTWLSLKIEGPFVWVLYSKSLTIRVYIRAPRFWKLPYTYLGLYLFKYTLSYFLNIYYCIRCLVLRICCGDIDGWRSLTSRGVMTRP